MPEVNLVVLGSEIGSTKPLRKTRGLLQSIGPVFRAAMTTLRARVTAGNAPTAVQMLGFDITDWANEGKLGNLNDVAAAENRDEVVPTALQAFAKHDGNWISAPVNVHSTNWVWVNKSALDAAGGKAPVVSGPRHRA